MRCEDFHLKSCLLALLVVMSSHCHIAICDIFDEIQEPVEPHIASLGMREVKSRMSGLLEGILDPQDCSSVVVLCGMGLRWSNAV